MTGSDPMLQPTSPSPDLRPSALRRSAWQRLAFVAVPILVLWGLVALVLWA
ncbi:hypothetical protein [Aureimonas ureilytica]|uniref:hypothetical protein n=1 Tax=Aureimonas ureilytica TaxID=401562 RepID=UPI0003A0AB15|nr:hypothetical protein [Aureimonas ureilytica]